MMTMIAKVQSAVSDLDTRTEDIVNNGCDHECVRLEFGEKGGYVQSQDADVVVARNTRGVMHPAGTVVILHRIGERWAFDS